MQLQKTAALTRSEIVAVYWLEFLHEVKANITNIPSAGETWHIEPTEMSFWKWFIREKLDTLATVEAVVNTDKEEGENDVEVAQKPEPESPVEP